MSLWSTEETSSIEIFCAKTTGFSPAPSDLSDDQYSESFPLSLTLKTLIWALDVLTHKEIYRLYNVPCLVQYICY